MVLLKLWDERGRLFGLVNVVDLLVLLVLVGGIFIFYDRYGRNPAEKQAAGSKVQEIEVVIFLRNNYGFIKDSLVRDKPELRNFRNGEFFGRITDIKVRNALILTRTSSGLNKVVADPRRYDIFLTVRCRATKAGREYFVAGEPVKIGEQVRLFAPRTYIEGYPLEIREV